MTRRWSRSAVVYAVGGAALCVAVGAVVLVAERATREADSASRGTVNPTLIEDGLYMGGLVPDPPRGTRAVLNLCETEDPYRAEVHAWEPIPDAPPAPGLDWLRKQVAFVGAQRAAGLTTYVHCRAGISRSGMVVVAYLMREHHWTRDRALEFVRSKRPWVRPNPAFMDLLLEWEKEVARTDPR